MWFPVFQYMSITSCLVIGHHIGSTFFTSPTTYLYIWTRCPWDFFSRQKSPSSLSLSLHETCSSPFIVFTAFCWSSSSKCMSPLHQGAQNKTQCYRWTEGKDCLPRPAGNVPPNAAQNNCFTEMILPQKVAEWVELFVVFIGFYRLIESQNGQCHISQMIKKGPEFIRGNMRYRTL